MTRKMRAALVQLKADRERDGAPTYVHWRTAEALVRLGLVEIVEPYRDPYARV